MRRLILIGVLVVLSVGPGMSRNRNKVPRWVLDVVHTPSLELSQDAPASLLFGETVLSRENDRTVMRCRCVYRILTVTGLDYGKLVLDFDSKSEVTDLEGWCTNGAGAFKQALDEDHITRLAVNRNFVDDSRQVVAAFDHVEKGDIVAFSYTLKQYSFFHDLFLPMGEACEVVRNSITVPDGVRVQVLNDPAALVRREGNRYVLENQPVFRSEPNQPPLVDRIPILAVSFNQKLGTWDAFAQAYWDMSKQALDVAPDTRKIVDDVVPFESPVQYIPAVLSFVSHNINYVDIELGKSGYVPRPCGFVLNKRYGDCKDMAFLAAAMLRCHGIEAWPVMAQDRSYGRIYEEFPGNQFNHVIVAVVLPDGCADLANSRLDNRPVLYFDPTDRITRPPFLPEGLEGTRALLIRENGGRLVTLPVSDPDRNRTEYNIEATLLRDGSVVARISEVKTGHAAFDDLRLRDRLSSQEEGSTYRSWISRVIPGGLLTNFHVDEQNGMVKTDAKINVQRYGVATSEGTYLVLDLMSSGKSDTFRRRTRRTDVRIGTPAMRVVRVTWHFPSGVTMTHIPANDRFDSPYLEGERQVDASSTGIRMTLITRWKVGEIPAKEYKAFRKAYRRYLKMRKTTVVVQGM